MSESLIGKTIQDAEKANIQLIADGSKGDQAVHDLEHALVGHDDGGHVADVPGADVRVAVQHHHVADLEQLQAGANLGGPVALQRLEQAGQQRRAGDAQQTGPRRTGLCAL